MSIWVDLEGTLGRGRDDTRPNSRLDLWDRTSREVPGLDPTPGRTEVERVEESDAQSLQFHERRTTRARTENRKRERKGSRTLQDEV